LRQTRNRPAWPVFSWLPNRDREGISCAGLLRKSGRKKTGPQAGFSSKLADYFEAAGAAAAEAASAAAEAAEAAAEAAEAAASAAAGEAAASVAAGATGVAVASAAGAAAGAVVSATGAAGAASSFLLQAARATASRETISRDFFMVFP
jgi:hypothetical protein